MQSKSKPKSKLKPKLKSNMISPKIIPIRVSSKSLSEMVTTIGFQVSDIREASKLKLTLEDLKIKMGGKGAGLVEMTKLKIPVPPAFNLSTSLCALYFQKQRIPGPVLIYIKKSLAGLEKSLHKKFGDLQNPLLLSIRSGARVSMPGMMDTILNLGLNNEITASLAEKNPEASRFWWDCYRRFIQMFADVVLQYSSEELERSLESWKKKDSVKLDSELSGLSLKSLSEEYLRKIKDAGKIFPQDPQIQLTMAIEAVFRSWNTERAIHYRRLNHISEESGTSVTVQAMVFGNRNAESGTGVVFTRNPSTGEKQIYGEYLMTAQGEDVVAGVRTPQLISQLKKQMPKVYALLEKALQQLENHFREVQDVEFTIENSKLFILQTRSAKRTAQATIEHLLQLVSEKQITKLEAIERLSFDQIKQLLHPTLKVSNEKRYLLAKGLPASPGAVSGRVVFDPETALQFARAEQKVILVRRETSPEDIMGMSAAEGILTATGGMTSHAAVVARGMGKACVVGCSEIRVDEYLKKATTAQNENILEGDFITLNGASGEVFKGELPTEPTTWGKSAQTFFNWADEISEIPVYANADTPEQALLAIKLGAKGIGLCRTEHMFFDKERILKFRELILSDEREDRERVAAELLRFQYEDFVGIFKAMKGLSVCVRLLDPPLHEFLPRLQSNQKIVDEEVETLARELSISKEKLKQRIEYLHETNPMLGHRGCRLGVTFPEIYEMQIRALAKALSEVVSAGDKLKLKIMIPLVMNTGELQFLLKRLKAVLEESMSTKKALALVEWGTMIELPRACLISAEIAPLVDFFSFGTNDLTQTSLGISRDDASKFISAYKEAGILKVDPFESLDQEGLGRLIELSVREAREAKKDLDIGVCGEHGGDPQSIEFFSKLKFSSVSCSPFRVPIARLATARAVVRGFKGKGGTPKSSRKRLKNRKIKGT